MPDCKGLKIKGLAISRMAAVFFGGMLVMSLSTLFPAEALEDENPADEEVYSENTGNWSHRLTAVNVATEAGQPVVKLTTTGAPKTSVSYLTRPPRMLLKVYNTLLTWKPTTLAVHQTPLRRIRAAQHDQDTWVVFDLDASVKWDRQSHSRGVILRLPTSHAALAEDPGMAPVAESGGEAGARVAGAQYQMVDGVAENLGERTRLTLTADGLSRYRVKHDKAQQQIQLDFYGAALNWSGSVAGIPTGAIRRVRARQVRAAGEPIVQVTIQLTQWVPYAVYKDQNQVVLEVDNPGTLGAVSGRRGNLNTMVSIDLENANLISVLRALAQDAGFDLVLTPGAQNVTGTQALLTLSIIQQRLGTLLDFILRSRGMAYTVSGNIIRVGLASEFPIETRVFTLKNMDAKQSNIKESILAAMTDGANGKVVLDEYANQVIVSAIPSDMPQVQAVLYRMDVQRRLTSRTFRLNFTKAEVIAPMVESRLSSLGSLETNEGDNCLIVNDIPGNLGQISELIRSLDTKSQQIMIEARIVEVSRSNEQDLGIRWTASNAVGDDPHITARVSPARVDSAGQLTVGTVSSGLNLNATLSALEAKGLVNMISNPRIATLNNQSATLTASQNIPYATSTVSQGVVSNTVNYLELPITLTVTPQVMSDQRVLLNPLTLMVTTPVGERVPPVTTTRSATTQMMVRDGETIAIGGMVRDEETAKESKVPLLGDLPLLGFLFRSHVAIKNKIELVVFLTPHILE